MRDAWRGGLNDLITVLGVVAVWQPLADCARDPECAAGYALPGRLPSPAAAARALFTVATTLLPTYSNYVNTAAQHGQLRAADYGLPDCFDDPPAAAGGAS